MKGYIKVIPVVFVAICLFITKDVPLRELKKKYRNSVITTAEIYDVGHDAHGHYIIYRYTVRDSVIKGSLRIEDKSYLYISAMMHKKFPVAYPVADPWSSQIMLTKRDFELFDLPFPDSLKWVSTIIK